MRKLLALASVVLILGACTPAPTVRQVATHPDRGKSHATGIVADKQMAARGLAFAEANCSGCHAVILGRGSPNPEAPTFEAVVNTPGLSLATLKPWLLASHDFPEMMNFEIAPDQVDGLVAYMMTLQKPNYTPNR